MLSMKEKKETLLNDQRVRNDLRNTLHGRASADLDLENTGRHAKHNTVVTGGADYPRLPEASPWHHDPVPPEAPLGIDVNALEPVGTEREVQASLGDLSPGIAQSGGALTETERATLEAQSVAPSSPPTNPKPTRRSQ